MEAGKLRHRLVLSSASATVDSFGQSTITWSAFATVWGAIYDVMGREYFEARQQEAIRWARVVIRYRGDVTNETRVTYGSQVYDVDSVLYDPTRERTLTLMCKEMV